jgi:hypothetical protein
MKHFQPTEPTYSLTFPSDGSDDILLMGYSLLLSAAEKRTLRECAEEASRDGQTDGELPSQEHAEKAGCDGGQSTFLRRLNGKAYAISGRKLVIEEHGKKIIQPFP